MTRCTFDPTRLAGQPIGQLHCPSCLCMVIAGLKHPPCDPDCDMQDDDDRAFWGQVDTLTETEG